MDKQSIKVGATYLCSTDNLSWSFVGKAISKEAHGVQIELLKCHPEDRLSLDCDNPVMDVNYLSILDSF